MRVVCTCEHVLVGGVHVRTPVHASLVERGRVGKRHVLRPQLGDKLVQQVHVAGVACLLCSRRLIQGGRQLCRQCARELCHLAGRGV